MRAVDGLLRRLDPRGDGCERPRFSGAPHIGDRDMEHECVACSAEIAGDDHRRPLARRRTGEVSILDDTRFPDCGDQLFGGIHTDTVERGIASSIDPQGDLDARRVHRPLLLRDEDDVTRVIAAAAAAPMKIARGLARRRGRGTFGATGVDSRGGATFVSPSAVAPAAFVSRATAVSLRVVSSSRAPGRRLIGSRWCR